MPPWQQGHLPPLLPTLSMLQMFSKIVCNCKLLTLLSACTSPLRGKRLDLPVQLALPIFMTFSFHFVLLHSRMSMQYSTQHGAVQPAGSQHVTCVSILLSRWCHRCIKPCQVLVGKLASRQPAQKAPSGSADFCDIRLVQNECVSPFNVDVLTWLKEALFLRI